MKSLEWTVGDVRIVSIVELEAGEVIQGAIPMAKPESIRSIDWLCPRFATQEGHLKALVQAFLVQSGNHNILIDSCNGNDKERTDIPEWNGLQTDFLTSLEAAGVSVGDIDIVACTHLHMDHVGWNTIKQGGRWVPTFPKARYYFAREEYEYWVQRPEREIRDDKAAFEDSVAPIIKANLATLVDPNHQIDQRVTLVPSPGHTPCHVSVHIESGGSRALISGDFLHHPCQIAEPEWTTDADTFPDQGIVTRRKLLGQLADTGTLLIGSHFAGPVAGWVRRVEGKLILET